MQLFSISNGKHKKMEKFEKRTNHIDEKKAIGYNTYIYTVWRYQQIEMKWLKKIIQKLFKKEEIKLIEEHKELSNARKDFRLHLIQTADLERDEGNGYKIIPPMKLKEML